MSFPRKRESITFLTLKVWIPAFAGMTSKVFEISQVESLSENPLGIYEMVWMFAIPIA